MKNFATTLSLPLPPKLMISLAFLLLLAGCHGTTPPHDTHGPPNCQELGGVLNDSQTECVDKPQCDQDSECLRGKKCHAHQCLPKNYCTERKHCEANETCDTPNTTCVPLSTCDEKGKCPDKFTCVSGLCFSNNDICAPLKCGEADGTPGICDPTRNTQECVDADPCDFSLSVEPRTQCTAGKFCNPHTTPPQCIENKCMQENGLCEAGGFCGNDLDTGVCRDKPDCQEAKECLPGRICLHKENAENKCTAISALHKECDGNQIPKCGKTRAEAQECARENVPLVAQIHCFNNEKEGCNNAIDCHDPNEVCGDKDRSTDKPPLCVQNNHPSVQCQEDTVGQHKHTDTLIELKDAINTNTLSLCNEADWFSYTADKKGELYIHVRIQPRDVGNREVTLEIFKQDGYTENSAPIGSQSSDSSGDVSLRLTVEANEKMYVKISGKSPNNEDVRLRYNLNFQFITQSTIDACQQAFDLPFTPSPREGSLEAQSIHPTGVGQNMNFSCSGSSSQTTQTIYKVHVEEKRHYLFNAFDNQDSSAKLAIAIRQSCEIENDLLCVNSQTNKVRVSKILDPGEYYVIVTGEYGSNSITLLAEAEKLTCTSEDNYCGTGGLTAYVCNESQTGLVPKTCDQLKCDPQRGDCRAPTGDTCHYPLKIAKVGEPATGSVEISSVHNTYSPTSCSNQSSIGASSTSGPDFVVQAEVPPGHVLVAKSSTKDLIPGIYLTEDCSSLNGLSPACFEAVLSPFGYAYGKEDLATSYENDTQSDKTIYVVFDLGLTRFGGVGSGTNVFYDVQVKPKKCTKDEYKCAVSERHSIQCDPFGTGLTNTPQYCGLGCQNDPSQQGFGECRKPKESKCYAKGESSGIITPNQEIHGSLVGSKNTHTPQILCGELGYGASDPRPDLVYRLETKPNKVYSMTLKGDNDPGFAPVLWFANACDATTGVASECLTSLTEDSGGTVSTKLYSKEESTYWLVIEDYYGKNYGNFILNVEEKAPDGVPYTIDKCDGNNAVEYSRLGEKITKDCTTLGGCEDNLTSQQGYCKNGDAQTCLTSKLLYTETTSKQGNESISDLSTYPTDIPSYSSEEGSCWFERSTYTKNDAIYRFELNANDLLTINYKDNSKETIALLQTECKQTSTCIGNLSQVGSRKIQYKAEKKEMLFFIIKKNTTSSLVSPSFDWRVENSTPLTCAPFSITCSSQQHIQYCDAQGNPTEFTCPHGCKQARCQPKDSKFAESCSEALPVNLDASGDPISPYQGRYLVDFQNLKEGSDHKVSCVPETHYDIYFKIKAKKNDFISVSAKNIDGISGLYLFKSQDCGSIETSCTSTRVLRNKNSEAKLTFVADGTEETQEFIIGMAAPQYYSFGGRKEGVLLDFEIAHPSTECETSPASTCTSGVITYCDPAKRKLLFSCPSGACKDDHGEIVCDSSSSNPNKGTTCFDAIPLTGTTGSIPTSRLDTNQASNSRIKIDNFYANACLLDHYSTSSPTIASASERYYSIRLNQNDKITIDFSSEETYHNFNFYISQGCLETEEICIKSIVKASGDDERTLTYVAPQEGLYYIVVDSERSENQEYSFEWTIEANQPCEPGTAYCKDETTSVQCLTDKTPLEYKCSHSSSCNGNASAGLCDLSSEITQRDSCADVSKSTFAYDIEPDPPSVTTSSPIKSLNAIIPLMKASDSLQLLPSACTGSNTNGNDVFFKVKLPKNATIRSYLRASRVNEAKLALYYIEAGKCTVTDSCLAGTQYQYYDGIESPTSPLTYRNTSNDEQDILVVVDSYKGTYDTDITAQLFIEVDIPNCDPLNPVSECQADNQTLRYCDSQGFLQNYTCAPPSSGNACDSITNTCAAPLNDQCHDSKIITFDTGDEVVVTDTFSGASNAFNLPSGNACIYYSTAGVDRVYQVVIPDGKKLIAEAVSTEATAEDVQLYLATSCNALSQTCVAQSEQQRASNIPEKLEYIPSQAGETKVFAVVDSFFRNLSGGFKVTFKIEDK